MPVRDAGPYLEPAVRSILDQSFCDFEFVIRDDASLDGSAERLRAFAAADPRIRLVLGDRPLGPAGNGNWVVREAKAPIVARMDADDISRPERLARQLAVLEAEPEACLVGTLWEGIDSAGRRVRPRDRWRLRHGPFAPFPHGSIMFHREAFERIGGYRVECSFWEDADLYLRLARVGRLLVLPDSLYLHRASALSTRLVSDPNEVERAVEEMYRTFELGSLAAPAGSTPGKVLPKVFVSLGSTRLWAGDPPAMLGPLLRRGALRLNAQSAATLAWALWGTLSPRSLRFALLGITRLRDAFVRRRFPDGRAVEWQPRAAASTMRSRSGRPSPRPA